MKTLLVAILLCMFSASLRAGSGDSSQATCVPRPGWSIVLNPLSWVHINEAPRELGVALNIDGWNELVAVITYDVWEGPGFHQGEEAGWQLLYRRYLSQRDPFTLFAAVFVRSSYVYASRLRLSEALRSMSTANGTIGVGGGPGLSFLPLPRLELSGFYAVEYTSNRVAHGEFYGPYETRACTFAVELEVKLHL